MNTPDARLQRPDGHAGAGSGAVRIRRAGPDDAPALTALITGLARYERLEDQCHPDPAALRAQLQPDARPPLEALLAESDGGEPVGFALFFYHYSTFLTNWGAYLEDLFVAPECRGRGIGLALFRRVAQTAAERGCARLEWSVLDWNEPARDFYRKLGATELSEWQPMRLSGDALRRLAGADAPPAGS